MNIEDVQGKIGAIAGLYQMFFTGDSSRIHDVVAAGYEQVPPQTPDVEPGVDNFLQGYMEGFGAMFSDVKGEATHVLVDGEYAMVRGEYSAVHSGEAFGVPATGKTVSFPAVDIHQIQDGRITKTWHLEDFMGIYNQIRAGSG